MPEWEQPIKKKVRWCIFSTQHFYLQDLQPGLSDRSTDVTDFSHPAEPPPEASRCQGCQSRENKLLACRRGPC
ncbi:hypothetical protein CEXT_594731 [Caerostris extrusa]|uniref:Uncharacterized protein n=1 Tax=Caerostris extrusa TaxID=172846 RepID=A0AAV4P653_CAEEX|nr:hypothetical protein CEXT_594731 [Caerostris extrusa]